MPVTQAYCGGSYAAWTAGALFLVHQLCSAPSALKYTQEHAQYTQSVTPSSCGGMFVRAVCKLVPNLQRANVIIIIYYYYRCVLVGIRS